MTTREEMENNVAEEFEWSRPSGIWYDQYDNEVDSGRLALFVVLVTARMEVEEASEIIKRFLVPEHYASREAQHKEELDGSRDAFKVMSQACDRLEAELERLKADRERERKEFYEAGFLKGRAPLQGMMFPTMINGFASFLASRQEEGRPKDSM